MYICGDQKRTKNVGCNIRCPYCVPFLSVKNKKLRLQQTQAHPNWKTKKDLAWSDESQFLLRHTHGSIRIWHQHHESMDPTCFMSTVLPGCGVMVWGMHTYGLLIPINHCFNATVCLSIADHLHPLITKFFTIL